MKKLISKLTFIFYILITILSCTSNEKKVAVITDFKRMDSLNLNTMDSLNFKSEKKLSEECDCKAVAYLTKSPAGGIELLNQNKKIVKRISFNEENEEFIKIELKNYNKEMFQISSLTNPFNAQDYNQNEYTNLWIENRGLRIFLPDAKKKVNLFSEPNEESVIIGEVSASEKYSIQPIKCCKKWIFGIYYDKNGNESKGWFHPDDICSSPITNC